MGLFSNSCEIQHGMDRAHISDLNLTDGNQSFPNDIKPQSISFFLIVIFVVFLPGIFGNILVLVIFGRGHISLDKPVNSLIRLLAICDVTVLLNLLFSTAIKFLNPELYVEHGYAICTVYVVSAALPILYSSFVAVCMALDRYFAICTPYFYERFVSIQKVKITLITGAVFVVAIVVMLFTPLSFQIRSKPGTGECISFWNTRNSEESVYGITFASFGLACTSVIVVTNVKVLVEVIHMTKRIGPRTVADGKTSNVQNYEEYLEAVKVEIQFAKTLLGVLVTTVACWIPMTARIIGAETGTWVDDNADQVIYFCFGLPLVVDPYSYVILRRRYRKAFKKIIIDAFKRCCYCRQQCRNVDIVRVNDDTGLEDIGTN